MVFQSIQRKKDREVNIIIRFQREKISRLHVVLVPEVVLLKSIGEEFAKGLAVALPALIQRWDTRIRCFVEDLLSKRNVRLRIGIVEYI